MWKTLRAKFDTTDSLVSLALGLAVVLVVGMTVVNYVKSKTQTATSTTKEEQLAKENGGTTPATYVVKEGDTLWSIAETYYKSGYNWVDIAKANNLTNSDTITTGDTLTIPTATPIVVQAGTVSSASTSIAPKDASYTVATGDSLWSIAEKEYGNGYRWVDIAKANNLSNPDVIHAGNILQMP